MRSAVTKRHYNYNFRRNGDADLDVTPTASANAEPGEVDGEVGLEIAYYRLRLTGKNQQNKVFINHSS
jgi:hypothetical protein